MNENGELGLPTDKYTTTPFLQEISFFNNKKIINFMCGCQHSIVLTGFINFINYNYFLLNFLLKDNEKCYSFGNNIFGELGIGNNISHYVYQEDFYQIMKK